MRRLLTFSGCVAGIGAFSAWVLAGDHRRATARPAVDTSGTQGYVSVVSSPAVGHVIPWRSHNDWNLWEIELASTASNN
jgi:hypothetical protein